MQKYEFTFRKAKNVRFFAFAKAKKQPTNRPTCQVKIGQIAKRKLKNLQKSLKVNAFFRVDDIHRNEERARRLMRSYSRHLCLPPFRRCPRCSSQLPEGLNYPEDMIKNGRFYLVRRIKSVICRHYVTICQSGAGGILFVFSSGGSGNGA